MALDDLKGTVETLRERIQVHRSYLEEYEIRTRSSLIDPMLRVLGWDVEDPNYIEVEYRVSQDRVDYVLKESGDPIAVIEAKSLGTPLDEKTTKQAFSYANTLAVSYAVVTNGDHWRMFEVFKQVPVEDRILMSFQLTQDEPYACALQALGIWRPNLAGGRPQTAATPVLAPDSSSTAPDRGQKADYPSKDAWKRLDSLTVKKGMESPACIKFPNSEEKPLKHWADLLESVAEYLIKTKKISDQNCPVIMGNAKDPLLNTDKIRKSEEDQREIKIEGLTLWLNTRSDTETKYKQVRWLLTEFDGKSEPVLVSA